MYCCPNTGHRVQSFSAEETSDNADTYEAVMCVACQQVHLVNPVTGRVLRKKEE